MIEATKLEYARRLKDATGGGKRGAGEVFRTFITMAACAVSAGRREEEYLKAIQGYEREDLDALCEAFGLLVGDMERHPCRDLLGSLYTEVGAKGDRDWRGEFYTPWSVCDFMAAMQLGDAPDGWPEDRPANVLEPACGSGGMVLSFAREMTHKRIPLSRARFECWDVAKVAWDMAYTNLSLWGIPATVVWGNSLSQEVYRSWSTVLGLGLLTTGAGQAVQEQEEAPDAVCDTACDTACDNVGDDDRLREPA